MITSEFVMIEMSSSRINKILISFQGNRIYKVLPDTDIRGEVFYNPEEELNGYYVVIGNNTIHKVSSNEVMGIIAHKDIVRELDSLKLIKELIEL